MIFKITFCLLIFILSETYVFKNIKNLSEKLREIMTKNTIKNTGSDMGWNSKFGLYSSYLSVIFLSLMFNLAIYVFLFS